MMGMGPHQTTPPAHVAKRDGNPREGAPIRRRTGRATSERTLKRREVYERMNSVSQEAEGRCRRETASHVRNGAGTAGMG
jgi:hypothetical protein